MSESSHVTYKGSSGATSKHIVFIASDHEYRSEETCTALARILAKHHGYDCTVIYGVDENGEILAGGAITEGLEVLDDADVMMIFARFLDLPDDQMMCIDGYLKRGGSVVGLRTSSHGFKISEGKKYSHYDFFHKGDDFKNGFGEQIIGNTWEGHYGKNHKQGTRVHLVSEQKDHPILRGVKDGAFCYAGAYDSVVRDDFTVLANIQPLVSMKKDAALDESKPPVASAWTRYYITEDGKKGRVFHSTQGASEDLLDDDYRRMIVNGICWAAGDEDDIKRDGDISFVGIYQPSTFKNGGHVEGVKPVDLQDMESDIMPRR